MNMHNYGVVELIHLPQKCKLHQQRTSQLFYTQVLLLVKTMLKLVLVLSSVLLMTSMILASGQCHTDQQALLIRLKKSLTFDNSCDSCGTKVVQWNTSSDCCSWAGVSCINGRVTGLDLSEEWISGGINSRSSLFNLLHLQRLNLAVNRLNYTKMPPEFGKLADLRYLNLSYAGFAGQIPIEVSYLKKLETLDISVYSFLLGDSVPRLMNPNLRMLLLNFSKLTELHLDGVKISDNAEEWCDAVSSSLPALRVLSLYGCNLSGPITSSLLKIRSLSKIDLRNNKLSMTVPRFLANFTNLTSLSLSNSALFGTLPKEVMQVPTLQYLDLSYNYLLRGSLPDFHQNGSLQTLVLSNISISGRLPDSVGNLKMLSRIEMANCKLNGTITSSVESLEELELVDLSFNEFTGVLPSFDRSIKLSRLDVSHNNFEGLSLPFNWENLVNLADLDLRKNRLKGPIPPSLFSLPSLFRLQLSNNQFSGLLELPRNVSFSHLRILDLSSNQLEGPLPTSVFKLQDIQVLSLASNKFSGALDLGVIQQLKNLSSLDLSHNNLSLNVASLNSSSSSNPQLGNLQLASCKLETIPQFLKLQSKLRILDLSDNLIRGKVPSWLWGLGLYDLNLSHNSLESMEKIAQSFTTSLTLSSIDLHANQLQGAIPHVAPLAVYVDYSNNNFSSVIPDSIGDDLSVAIFFSLSNNNLQGSIPLSICKAIYLHVLDLSKNSLNGTIPTCLIKMTDNLGVLNLQRNNLQGIIPNAFPRYCSLQTFKVNDNSLQGLLPNSLASCTSLEVLDLGNNEFKGLFPCHLKSISNLRVLVLRSNKLYGPLSCINSNGIWPMLQILDLASNSFNENLPNEAIRTLEAMKLQEKANQTHLNHLQFEVLQLSRVYYQLTVTVTSKGLVQELEKILTIFTYLDFSCNDFSGPIPESIGELQSMIVLNLSHNALSSSIPKSLGKLTELESLDLSSNNLNGSIPIDLTNLNFLSYLNLSSNRLEGKIPTNTQLQSFSELSFANNSGLCGPPLRRTCSPTGDQEQPSATIGDADSDSSMESSDEFELSMIGGAIGFVIGYHFVIGPLFVCRRWRAWCFEQVDRLIFCVFPHLRNNGGRRRGTTMVVTTF